MYRAVIEHPDWVPQELKKRPDERFGDDKGRIYRIVPKAGKVRRELPSLAKAEDAELLDALQHPNAWQRETAQRLILENADLKQRLIPKLTALVSNPQGARRASALALLNPVDYSQRMASEVFANDMSLARLALQLAEDAPNQSSSRQPIALPAAATPALQMQVLLTLIGKSAPDMTLVKALMDKPPVSPWIETGLRLAAGDAPHELLAMLLVENDGRFSLQLIEALTGDVGRLSSPQAIADLVTRLAKQNPQANLVTKQRRMLVALQLGLARRGMTLDKILTDQQAGPSREAYSDILSAAASTASDSNRPAEERIGAVQLLAFHAPDAAMVAKLAVSASEQGVRQAAVVALSRHGSPEQWKTILSRFPRETPAVRRAMLDQVLGDAKRAAVLLDEIEAGRIKAAELDPAQMNRLKQLGNAEFKARVGKLLAAATPADRAQALADYQQALEMPNDPKRGQAIFQKNCATCHKIGEIGVNVAPDISDSRTKTPAQILADVIQPNRAIDANYLAYNVRLEDGETLTGILAAETATSITLRQPGDKTLTLSRSEIADLKSSGLSLMPDGLERQIPLQDMADLISFVKNWRYLDGKTPLGK
jgi:putative heme-binding domain-containing protein